MVSNCRVCESGDLLAGIDFGALPIAHRPMRNPNDHQDVFPFTLHICNVCGLLQNLSPIDPTMLYTEFNFNVSSWKPEPHLPAEVDSILKVLPKPRAIDIGCNDGRFLESLRERGAVDLMGIEPNIAHSARAKERGFEIVNRFLSLATATEIVEAHGKFDLAILRQVAEHIPDLRDFFAGLRTLVGDDGYLFIDIPDISQAVAAGDCSVLWEEHVNYFCRDSLEFLLRREGFEPLVADSYNFSGGTLAILARRLSAAAETAKPVPPRADLLSYANRVQSYGERLRAALGHARNKGLKCVIFGSGVRACMAVNGLRLGDMLSVAIDDQPERQGRYLPGAALPIVSPAHAFVGEDPIVCLLAVNSENDENVMETVKRLTSQRVTFVPLCAPGDIHGGLNRLEAISIVPV